jgi:hypothetical protein
MTENGRVSLREYIEARFDALEEKLAVQQAHYQSCMDDHEGRIRDLEKREPVRNVAEAVIGIVAVAAAALGIKAP